MCGICGTVNFHSENYASERTLVRMMHKLHHRGPDSTGLYVNRNVGLGFTRLSIIDLSGGNQPLYNEDRSVVVVCNGEIFNYKELRQEMSLRNYTFKTDSDVEVLIPLYETYGFDFFHKLNGQFSFALYDERRQTLFCARDHVGITPFYYTVAGDSFVFASEIKAILEHPLVQKEVDLVGLDQMITLPGLVAPRTMFKNIHSLKSGHYLTVKDGRVTTHEYWDLNYPVAAGDPEPARPEAHYLEQLDAAITRAVALRLHADVPVGFYLSGGLDSSIIAAKSHQLQPGSNPQSFSIDFEDRSISEKKYQQLMVEHINSQHNETTFGSRDIEKYLKQAIYHSECPIKETYNTASLALSRMAADQNIKVVLSGEGADELFGGYVGYRFDAMRQSGGPADAETLQENSLREALWGDENFFYEKDYHAFSETKQMLYSDRLNEAFDYFNCLNFPLVDKSKIKGRHLLHKRSYLDFKLRLADHLIADHGDRMVMANSVEGRYPFLDKDLIELVAGIPPGAVLKNMEEKYILKQLAANLIPREIVDREKFSFVAPGSDYLLKENITWIKDMLSYDLIKKQGYFNPDVVERLKQQYSDKDFALNLPFDNDYLIIVLNLSVFLHEFNIPNRN